MADTETGGGTKPPKGVAADSGARRTARPGRKTAAGRETTSKPTATRSGGGGRTAGTPPLHVSARDLLSECRGRVQRLREDWTLAAEQHLDHTFEHGENILSDNWEPKHLIRDSAALAIHGYGAVRKMYDSAYRFFAPKDGG
jgi:hypothetical protein